MGTCKALGLILVLKKGNDTIMLDQALWVVLESQLHFECEVILEYMRPYFRINKVWAGNMTQYYSTCLHG